MTNKKLENSYENLTTEEQMFLIKQGMRVIQCGGGSNLYREIRDNDLNLKPVSRKTIDDPLCMNCRYAPAKHLP
ncbi:hypothetical protein K9L16_00350 [Candidatus Pacearchaeota archaeon]|nr:hypothetical protein [Candidatus Pacearchaeota archaeon]